MAPSANAPRRTLEWRVLSFLCANFGDAEIFEQSGARDLTENHFLDPVHRALFLEISQCRARSLSREQLRRRLPEVMTRLGWPDLDFDFLFSPPHPDAKSIRELVSS